MKSTFSCLRWLSCSFWLTPLFGLAFSACSSPSGEDTGATPVNLDQLIENENCTPTACTPVAPTDSTITDFQDVGPGGVFVDNDHFSDPNPNWWQGFYGSAYVYPSPELGYETNGEWHVTGTVADWSGFGLWMGACVVDMSAYRGVSFEIWGDAGASGAVKLFALTDPDSPPEQCRPNVGTCNPDAESCQTPFVLIPVPPTRGTAVTVLWSDFSGGSPVASPDPSRIIQLMWAFDWYDWAGTKAQPYTVDVHVDDVRLVE